MNRIFFLILWLMAVACEAQIPAGRTIDWTQAGVSNLAGIRASRTVYETVPGLDTTGASDCGPAINSAIAACPSNEIVMLPAGKLLISTPLNIYYNQAGYGGGITLQGAGSNSTSLLLNAANAILIGNNNAWSGYSLNGYSSQSNGLVLTNMLQGKSNMWATAPVDCVPGDVLIIDRQDDLATGWALVFNNDGITNSIISGSPLTATGTWSRGTGAGIIKDNFRQMVLCTGVANSTNVQFWPPLYLDWTNTAQPSCYAYFYKLAGGARYVGIENLQITNTVNSTSFGLVHYLGAYGCWIKNCKFTGIGSPFVAWDFCLNCDVDSCDFKSDISNPPNGDEIAMEPDTCSACLIENNSFSGYGAPLLLESSACGNVIDYNYITNCWNYQLSPSYYMGANIFLCHKALVAKNLVEGNVCAQIQADNYHGGCGYNTLFRNWIHGMDVAFGFPLTNNIKCIDIDRYGYYFNLMGNVVGSASVAAVPGAVTYAPTNGTFSTSINAMYRFGFPDLGNNGVNNNDVIILYQGAIQPINGYPIAYDWRVTNTLFHTNNYDYVTGGVPDGTVTMPASLVYSSQPSWWSGAWPPIGPDLTPMVSTIPAMARFNGGVNYTLSVSSNPSVGGTVSGGGSFASGSSVTVTASANWTYKFVNWTLGGAVQSTSSSYTFTLSSDTSLVANFSGPLNAPVHR